MIQNADGQMLLYRTRLLLEEGQNDAALEAIQAIRVEDEKQQQDVAYLLAWCYVQRKQWNEALQALRPLIKQWDAPEALLERERIAFCLLYLGLAAVALAHFEDASLHFTYCLKVLHDRRVHLPAVRIKARCSLAMACSMRGLYAPAIQHYEEALRQCRHYNHEEEIPHVYFGLADAYLRAVDYPKASHAAQEALQLFEQRTDQLMIARTHNLLGRICISSKDYQQASEHYTQSLTIATRDNNFQMIVLNRAALADLSLIQGQIEEAKNHSHAAVDVLARVEDPYCQGGTYNVIGKVALEEARRSEGARRKELLEEAAAWFDQARVQLTIARAYPDIAEVYGYRAQALEELGRVEEAIECWRSGYEALSKKQLVEK
ncbi:MAG TPA: tetratricopeptide repeat protein [Ktedonosporobacter sp.]|nr:tetratricopeptide repeat protein [Ktedonosporobacter sp.]